jgi:hypothetical protein
LRQIVQIRMMLPVVISPEADMRSTSRAGIARDPVRGASPRRQVEQALLTEVGVLLLQSHPEVAR